MKGLVLNGDMKEGQEVDGKHEQSLSFTSAAWIHSPTKRVESKRQERVSLSNRRFCFPVARKKQVRKRGEQGPLSRGFGEREEKKRRAVGRPFIPSLPQHSNPHLTSQPLWCLCGLVLACTHRDRCGLVGVLQMKMRRGQP